MNPFTFNQQTSLKDSQDIICALLQALHIIPMKKRVVKDIQCFILGLKHKLITNRDPNDLIHENSRLLCKVDLTLGSELLKLYLNGVNEDSELRIISIQNLLEVAMKVTLLNFFYYLVFYFYSQ